MEGYLCSAVTVVGSIASAVAHVVFSTQPTTFSLVLALGFVFLCGFHQPECWLAAAMTAGR
jgi:hypothetical protein